MDDNNKTIQYVLMH